MSKKEVRTTIGMYDENMISKVTIGCTIPLAMPYANIKVEVEGNDPEELRRALIDILGVTLPIQSAADREYVNRYVNNVLNKR